MSPNQLRGDHFDHLHAALVDAFSREELNRFTRVQLEADLDAVAGDGPLNEVVTELIQWAERHGKLDELVARAAAERPEVAAIQQVAAAFPAWEKQAAAAGEAAAVGARPRARRAGLGGPAPAVGILLLVAAAAAVLAVWGVWGRAPMQAPAPTLPAGEAVTTPVTTPAPAAATAAPGVAVPFATARPGEYLIVVAEFYPPLAQYPQFDALDALVVTLEDAFAAGGAAHWRIEEYIEPIMDSAQAKAVGAAAGARVVIWGRVAANRLRINITTQRPGADDMAVRLQSGLAQPQELFFTVEADERLRSYVAPFLLGQYAYDVGEYAMAQALLAEASAGAAGDLPRGVEYAHLLEGSAFYMLGNYAAAIASYTAAVAENVGLLSAYNNRALAYWHERDWAAAQADVAYVLSKDPLHRDAHVLRGLILQGEAGEAGDPETRRELLLAAEAAYAEALAVLSEAEAAQAFDIFSQRGAVYAALGERERARQEYGRVLGPDFDCAPVFALPTASRQARQAGEFCASAAFNYAALFDDERIDAGSLGEVEAVNLLAAEHAPSPEVRGASYVRLVNAYEAAGRLADACAAAQEALVSLPDFQELIDYTPGLCARAAGE